MAAALPQTFFRWIITSSAKFSLLSVDADLVPPCTLQHAKSLAASLLNLGSGIDKFISDFPHGLDGGWPDVDPMDNFVTYSHIMVGDGGTPAMATGSSVAKRQRGVALALVMSVAVLHPDIVTGEMLRDAHDLLPQWVADAKQAYDNLNDKWGGRGSQKGRRARSRSVGEPCHRGSRSSFCWLGVGCHEDRLETGSR